MPIIWEELEVEWEVVKWDGYLYTCYMKNLSTLTIYTYLGILGIIK